MEDKKKKKSIQVKLSRGWSITPRLCVFTLLGSPVSAMHILSKQMIVAIHHSVSDRTRESERASLRHHKMIEEHVVKIYETGEEMKNRSEMDAKTKGF